VSASRIVPLICALLLAAAPATADEIPWTDKIGKAFDESSSSGKPIFIDAWAVWCVPCKEMDETTYVDPAVVEAMTGFVPLKVDQDSSENFCVRHDIEALPLVLYLDAEGREIGRREGLQQAEELLTSMEAVRSGYSGYLEAMAQKKPDASTAAMTADYLVRSGNPRRAIALVRRAMKGDATPRQSEELGLILAEAQLGDGDAKGAAAGFSRLADGASEPEVRGRALEGLVRALRERGRDGEADSTLELLRDEFPERAERLTAIE
jgi:thioredoxin-like negative regulator of GroEL